jgi:hypothetical protein
MCNAMKSKAEPAARQMNRRHILRSSRATGLEAITGWIVAAIVVAATQAATDRIPAPANSDAVRSVQVQLPRLPRNLIKTSWPGIGCWFWGAEEFKPEGYRRFLDLHAKHSAFRLLTTSIRHPVEVTDPIIHDQIKAAAIYALSLGMALVMDLDVRLARQAFMERYPDELQEIVRLRSLALNESGEVSLAIEALNLGDHYTFAARGYDSLAGRLLRAYSYRVGARGVESDSVQDITGRCRIIQADAQGIQVAIPGLPSDRGRTACVMAAFKLFTPDVFAPHLTRFERNILRQYADVPLAGACKDEWGFPGRFEPRTDDLYYSRFMAEDYVHRRPGRELIRDLLLMCLGEQGKENERAAAINHYMEMNWQRNGQVETEFYQSIKKVFGPQAMAATHPTWFPYLSREEAFKNGWHWWVATRDLAQTDEATPFGARTALAKKWHSPLWYNMYYNAQYGAYEEDLWRHALGGGRMNFHPLWPRSGENRTPSLLSGNLLRADCRIRLLNYISTAPIDCPVAIVFGHPAALNWAGPGFAQAGMELCNALWEQGAYADLIPSSEIHAGALRLGKDGHIQYGPQRYAAVVLVQPQFERPQVSGFFRQAVKRGQTALFRIGEWTMDFEGRPFDGERALPAEMKADTSSNIATKVLARLKATAVEPQTPCTMHRSAGFAASMMPAPSGHCRLLDGTVILASGRTDVRGDPIRRTIRVAGHEVFFDATGVAAVRLDHQGSLTAMAAGGLKSFAAGQLRLDLAEPVDVALWRDANGHWQGLLQGHDGEVPLPLRQLTDHWIRLRLPTPLP